MLKRTIIVSHNNDGIRLLLYLDVFQTSLKAFSIVFMYYLDPFNKKTEDSLSPLKIQWFV